MKILDVMLSQLKNRTLRIGYEGENMHLRVRINCAEMFSLYPDASVSMVVRQSDGNAFPIIVNRDDDIVIWDIASYVLSSHGTGKAQLTFTEGEEIIKTFKFSFFVDESIIANGEAPEHVADWLDVANEALTEFGKINELSASAITLDSGEPATAEITNVDGHKNILIGIPVGEQGARGEKGDKGDTGDMPDFSIGTVTTGDPGTDAEVTMSGTQEEPVLNFTIPRGDTGNTTIDDEAGSGDTDKVWSADKVVSELDKAKLEKADAIVITDDTAEAVKTILDGADGEAMALTVDIEPVQDLHGYDYPWPGGGEKNLYDKDSDYYGQGKSWDYYTGELEDSTDYYGSPKIPVKPNTWYCRNVGPTYMQIYCYDANGDYLPNSSFISEAAFQTSNDVYFCAFNLSNDIDHDEVQVEQGTTPSDYKPYSNICPISGWTGCNVTVSPTQDAEDGTTYSITFPSSAGTVYGGTLTINKDGTGILTTNQEKMILDGSENWKLATYTIRAGGRVYIINTFYADIAVDYLKKRTLKCVCDSYDFIGVVGHQSSMTKNNSIGLVDLPSVNRIYIRDDQHGTSIESFKSALSSNNVMVCYELATPQLYQLSAPELVKTLKGINNIFADTGDILSVDYSANTKMYVDAGDENKQEQIDSIHGMIADSDAVMATESHAIGDVFICNNQLVRATDAIAIGETIVIGSNAEVTSIANELSAIWAAINA